MQEIVDKKESEVGSTPIVFLAEKQSDETVRSLHAENKGKVITCSYCKKPDHSHERCWSLQGRPNNRCRGRGGGSFKNKWHSEDAENVGSLNRKGSLRDVNMEELANMLKQVAV